MHRGRKREYATHDTSKPTCESFKFLRATPTTLYLALYLEMWRAKMKKMMLQYLFILLFILPKCYSSFSQMKSYCSSSLNKKILIGPFFKLFFFNLLSIFTTAFSLYLFSFLFHPIFSNPLSSLFC